jgi:hypothetical protein
MKRNVVEINNKYYKLTVENLDTGCPFSKDDPCCSWCPHFHYDKESHTLSITCSGLFVPIPLEGENDS